MRPLLVFAFALLAAWPVGAQRRPLPPPPPAQPASSSWLAEPAILAAYVATVVPISLARVTDSPVAGLALVGTGYALGPLAGWYVTGAPERGAAWTVVRAAAYGGAIWSFAAADYREDGIIALPAALLHGVAAGVVLMVPYALDLVALNRYVQREQGRRFEAGPVLVGGVPGVGLRLQW